MDAIKTVLTQSATTPIGGVKGISFFGYFESRESPTSLERLELLATQRVEVL